MSDIISLNERRQPVVYTVQITHHWDGTVETLVEGVSDDERSKEAVARALERAAIAYLRTHPADAMHAIMLANIDHAMTTTNEEPAVFRVGPSELASWADAVQEWETIRYSSINHGIDE